MAGFRYPHHWLAIALEAFEQAHEDHDRHGFSERFIAEMEDRDRYLEDYMSSLTAGAPPIFDFPGPVVISVSDLFTFTSARTYTTAYLTAQTTGTATVGIYKNGALVGSTFNMPAATIATSVPFPMTVAAGDYGQARVTAAGGGIAGLAVALG